MKRFITVLTVLALMAAGSALAQTDSDGHNVTIDVNAIAMIAASGGADYDVVAPATAGAEPTVTEVTDDGALEYTSVVASGNVRTIQASHGGNLPTGLTLEVLATVGANFGTSAGLVEVTGTDADVITAIGSCATDGSGPTVRYTLSIDDATALVAASGTTVLVTYTLGEDAAP